MIVGISHSKNKAYASRQRSIIQGMAVRAKDDYVLIHKDYENVHQWRHLLAGMSNVKGIVIMDARVPPPKIYRAKTYKDFGVADLIYGNLKQEWVDTNKNGYFDVAEMPDEYTQGAWVCRLIPLSIEYKEIHWWLSWYFRKMSVGAPKYKWSYPVMLDRWQAKLDRKTVRPLSSFISTNDYTGFAEKKGFSINWELLKEKKCFDWMIGQYPVKYTNPENGGPIKYMWESTEVGTAWHSGHSSFSGLGDLRYDFAYRAMKKNRGPTLLLTYACSVGEWQDDRSVRNVVSNILNSRELNNIKACLCSGIMQWGGSFNPYYDGEGHWSNGDIGRNFYMIMKEKRGKTLGEAWVEWINLCYKHMKAKAKLYPNEDKDYGGELLMAHLAINLYGDGTLLL